MVDQATQDGVSTEGAAPVAPAPTGNALVDSRARAAHFAELTKFFEAKQGAQSPAPNAPQAFSPTGVRTQTGQPAPSESDLALIEATHKDLAKRFPNNSQAREVLERARMDVFAGKPLDQVAISAAFSKAVETPADRETAAAVNELAKLVDAEGFVTSDKIPPRLLSGYRLPAGQYDAEATVGLLRTAKELGLTQDQIDKFIELQGGDDAS